MKRSNDLIKTSQGSLSYLCQQVFLYITTLKANAKTIIVLDNGYISRETKHFVHEWDNIVWYLTKFMNETTLYDI
jgi:hypothetical protein